MYTCTNASCRKVFSNPLKTLKLQQDSTEPYYAYPYCLTKIEETPKIISKQQKDAFAENQSEAKTKSSRKDENPPTCHFRLGYLNDRPRKEQIPGECLVCRDSVECMLKTMWA